MDLEMDQFVDDDIINNIHRSHDKAPGETQAAFGVAGSPTGTGRAEPYF